MCLLGVIIFSHFVEKKNNFIKTQKILIIYYHDFFIPNNIQATL
jgi:hypothetical protein